MDTMTGAEPLMGFTKFPVTHLPFHPFCLTPYTSTIMNKFLTIACLFFLACLFLPSLIACQSDENVYAEASGPAPSAPASTVGVAFAEHNRMAITQLYAYVAERLHYPTEMEGLALEGMVTATFTVAPNGTIAHVRIANSELPKPFGDTLVALIKAKKEIKFSGSEFQGSARFNLPVKFSL